MTWYTMQSDEGKRLQDKLNIIFIDLVSIHKKYGTPIDELIPVEKWGLFFSYIDNEKKIDYVKDLVKTEEGLMAANSIIRYMSPPETIARCVKLPLEKVLELKEKNNL